MAPPQQAAPKMSKRPFPQIINGVASCIEEDARRYSQPACSTNDEEAEDFADAVDDVGIEIAAKLTE